MHFSFRPSKFVGLEFNFDKEEVPFEKCVTFEEFISEIIKDKPANIDKFFDTYVKELKKSCLSLMKFCLGIQKYAEKTGNVELAKRIKVTYSYKAKTELLEASLHRRLPHLQNSQASNPKGLSTSSKANTSRRRLSASQRRES
jgi:hypothetical protein